MRGEIFSFGERRRTDSSVARARQPGGRRRATVSELPYIERMFRYPQPTYIYQQLDISVQARRRSPSNTNAYSGTPPSTRRAPLPQCLSLARLQGEWERRLRIIISHGAVACGEVGAA